MERFTLLVIFSLDAHSKFYYGPRANKNFPLFSYLPDSKNQIIIDNVLLANDRGKLSKTNFDSSF